MSHTHRNIPSSDDLGKKYFTSSEKIKPQFFEFDWVIIAEFFKWEDAYDFEQELIAKHFSNPLCLNGNYRKSSGIRYATAGRTATTCKTVELNAEARNRLSKSHRKLLVEMRHSGKTYKEIQSYFISIGIKIELVSLRQIYIRQPGAVKPKSKPNFRLSEDQEQKVLEWYASGINCYKVYELCRAAKFPPVNYKTITNICKRNRS